MTAVRYYLGDYPSALRSSPFCLHYECNSLLPDSYVDPARVACPSCGRVYDLRPFVPPTHKIVSRPLANGRVSRRSVRITNADAQIDLFNPLVRVDGSGWLQPVLGGVL